MDVRVPTVEELANMSPAELERCAHSIEVARRQLEAATALLVQRVEDSGVYLADGHRRVAAWGCGTNNWSSAESLRMVKLARAMKAMPCFAEAALEGLVGVAQMHAVGQVSANPRVRDHLGDADELFTSSVQELPFDDLATLLRHWEELADADGARSRHDRAMHDRRASIRFVGERAYLDAQGTAFDGVLLESVLQEYIDQEWKVEWDVLASIHGAQMHAGLMERTHAQRRFDALQRLFASAALARGAGDGADAGGGAAGPAITVDVLIDQATFEHELAALLGERPAPLPPSYAPQRRSQDMKGRVLDPRAITAASLVAHVRRVVLGADGVVLDMGRRQRLFTGALREAVMLSAHRCPVVGCHLTVDHCEADHLVPVSEQGSTASANGGPACGYHNRWKNTGARTFRDAKGLWHTYRADGSEIGWPVFHANLRFITPAVRVRHGAASGASGAAGGAAADAGPGP